MNATIEPAASESALANLRILAIFHYVFGALGILGLAFLCLHFAFMTGMMEESMPASDRPPAHFMAFMYGLYGTFALIGIAWTVLNVVAARSLQTRTRWLLCAITAGVNCVNVPLGTILGVLTLVALNQPGVKQAFR